MLGEPKTRSPLPLGFPTAMWIDPRKCVACGNCVAVCPMGAISIDRERDRAVVNTDECVECYTCFRGMSTENLPPRLVRGVRRALAALRLRFDPEPDICPTSAITPTELEWPRTVRRAFSDVQATHESTGILGRGTEEVKTNDVTGRVDVGQVGFTVELGRPGLGVRFREIERVASALAVSGVEFEENNPVTHLMVNRATGRLDPKILGEKVMSAIIEFRVPQAHVTSTLDLLEEVSEQLETVMALGLYARCDDEGRSGLEEVLLTREAEVLRAKTNLGLGRAERIQADPGPGQSRAGMPT